MTRRGKYFEEIQHLLEIGYEPKQIIKITGCSKATVYRIVDKLKTEARYEFKNLLQHDYLWKYQKTIENFSGTSTDLSNFSVTHRLAPRRNLAYGISLVTMMSLLSLPRNVISMFSSGAWGLP